MVVSRELKLLFTWFLVTNSYVAFADPAPGSNMVQVHVRTLEALESLPSTIRARSLSPIHYEIGEELQDLRTKLKQLHYRIFRLKNSLTRNVAFENKEILDLGNGHTLALKPLYRDRKKVCLWIEWTDETGMKIINTRLHLNTSDSMITGTDQGDDSGVILAINVTE